MIVGDQPAVGQERVKVVEAGTATKGVEIVAIRYLARVLPRLVAEQGINCCRALVAFWGVISLTI